MNAKPKTSANGNSVNSEKECRKSRGWPRVKISANTGRGYPCPRAIWAATSAQPMAASRLVIRTAINPPRLAGTAKSAVHSGRPQISTKNIGCSNAWRAKT